MGQQGLEASLDWMGNSMKTYLVLAFYILTSVSASAADVGAANTVYRMGNTGKRPGFGSVDLSKSAAVGSSILPLANGGTGLSAVGTSGNVLTSNGSAWVSQVPSLNVAVASKSANYTLTSSDQLALGDATSAGFTFTLPSATSNPGKIYWVKKTDSSVNAITIARAGSDTIDAATSTTINTQYEMIGIVSDGTATWQVISRTYPQGMTSYTPTFTGLGTVANLSAYSHRVGDSLEVYGRLQTGTTAASLASVTLPTGLAVDTSKISNTDTSTQSQSVGTFVTNGSNQSGRMIASVTTSASVVYFGGIVANGNSMQAANGNVIVSNTSYLTFQFKVPISGWK
jgi:hypothetical protein